MIDHQNNLYFFHHVSNDYKNRNEKVTYLIRTNLHKRSNLMHRRYKYFLESKKFIKIKYFARSHPDEYIIGRNHTSTTLPSVSSSFSEFSPQIQSEKVNPTPSKKRRMNFDLFSILEEDEGEVKAGEVILVSPLKKQRVEDEEEEDDILEEEENILEEIEDTLEEEGNLKEDDARSPSRGFSHSSNLLASFSCSDVDKEFEEEEPKLGRK